MLKKDCPKLEVERLRGGNGILHATELAVAEECHGHVTQFRRMVMDPGCSIGYHTHDENTEIYYILSGNPTGNDNGEEVQMGPGSVMVTGNGAGHALENRTNEPVELINLIVKK